MSEYTIAISRSASLTCIRGERERRVKKKEKKEEI